MPAKKETAKNKMPAKKEVPDGKTALKPHNRGIMGYSGDQLVEYGTRGEKEHLDAALEFYRRKHNRLVRR